MQKSMPDFPVRSKSITRIILAGLTVLAILAAFGYLLVYFYIAARRMGYPYELEWIEGGFVGQVGRILAGQTVYGPPGIEFTPFLYTPLYFYLSAAAAKITGPGFFPLRLVSVISSIVAMAGIFALVFRRSRNLTASFLAAGLLAASYRITGAWLDVARVDSLAVALLVLFCLALPPAPSRIRWLTAGLLAGLMVLTKQSMALAVAPFFAVHFIQYRSRALWMAAGFLLPLGLATLYLNISSEGWYSFYTIELLGQQAEWLSQDVIIGFWKTDILRHYFVSLGIAAAGLFLIFRDRRGEFWEWLALLAGALLCSFLARIKAGGYDNVLLPAVAVIAILLGIGWERISGSLLEESERLPGYGRDRADRRGLVPVLSSALQPRRSAPDRPQLPNRRRLHPIPGGISGRRVRPVSHPLFRHGREEGFRAPGRAVGCFARRCGQPGEANARPHNRGNPPHPEVRCGPPRRGRPVEFPLRVGGFLHPANGCASPGLWTNSFDRLADQPKADISAKE